MNLGRSRWQRPRAPRNAPSPRQQTLRLRRGAPGRSERPNNADTVQPADCSQLRSELKYWTFRLNFLINFGIFTKISQNFPNFLAILTEFGYFGACSRNSDRISSQYRREIAFFVRRTARRWPRRPPRRRGAPSPSAPGQGPNWIFQFCDWIFRSVPEFSPNFLRIFQIFCNPHWVLIFWSMFAKFRQHFISISARNSSFRAKIVMFRLNFQYSISQNWWRFLTEFSRLERCEGMLIL